MMENIENLIIIENILSLVILINKLREFGRKLIICIIVSTIKHGNRNASAIFKKIVNFGVTYEFGLHI
jgi:hypothetical protein